MSRAVQWAVIIASLVYALLFVRFELGGAAAYVLALLPALLAWIVADTWLAAAFMFMLPMYFIIGQWTARDLHYQPFICGRSGLGGPIAGLMLTCPF